MKATQKYTVLALSLLSFIFIYAKCEKDIALPACTGNCTGIFFSGAVLNMAYNTPIRDAQIQVTTPGHLGSAFDTVYVVGTVNTDANGNFSLIKSIDTAVHKAYTIIATMPSGYLTSPETSDQYSAYSANKGSQYFYSVDSGIRSIQFEAFPIIRLAIKLHRSSSLPTNNPYCNVGYSINDGGSYLVDVLHSSFQETLKNTDTTIYLETSPVLYTIVRWSKSTDSGIVGSGADSISCQPNTTNQISITY